MGDARGNFPNGSNVTPPFSKRIKMVHEKTFATLTLHARTPAPFRTSQRVLNPPGVKENCSDIKACPVQTRLDLSSQQELNYVLRLVPTSSCP